MYALLLSVLLVSSGWEEASFLRVEEKIDKNTVAVNALREGMLKELAEVNTLLAEMREANARDRETLQALIAKGDNAESTNKRLDNLSREIALNACQCHGKTVQRVTERTPVAIVELGPAPPPIAADYGPVGKYKTKTKATGGYSADMTYGADYYLSSGGSCASGNCGTSRRGGLLGGLFRKRR